MLLIIVIFNVYICKDNCVNDFDLKGWHQWYKYEDDVHYNKDVV